MHLGRCTRHLSAQLSIAVLSGVLLFAAIIQPSTASAGTAGASAKPNYLLALGDSLAAGYQPTDETNAPPIDHTTGYADRGYPGSYPADLAKQRHLDLIDLACPGETTSSMVGTPAETKCATTFKKEFGATSQLKAAESFLNRHRGQVNLLTLDLGANDIDNCGTSNFNLSCFSTGESEVTSQLPHIVATLRTTLRNDDPNAHIVAMNYYDPFLGLAYSPGSTEGSAAAGISVVATNNFNSHLQTIFKHYGVGIANVASAFKTDDALPLVDFDGHRVPIDVDDICRWTWMCPLPGSGSTANIHANTAGYRVIATAFTKVLTAR